MNFGSKMAKWLKLYAIYTFSTLPILCHRTTLLTMLLLWSLVSVGISKLGCTDMHFVEPGVKVNGTYYRNNLLAQKLIPDMRQLAQDDFFVFQQDGAPVHWARDTVAFLERETPDFIPPTLCMATEFAGP